MKDLIHILAVFLFVVIGALVLFFISRETPNQQLERQRDSYQHILGR